MNKNKAYIIPTPIGNMEDLTFRAKKIINELNFFCVENTLQFKKLSRNLNINPRTTTFNKFNESSKIDFILNVLKKEDIGIICDSGTPTISDPGQLLVKKLKEKDIEVITLPGATAITTALSGSGLLYKDFSFVGFLPKKKEDLIRILNKHKNSDLIVSYESPHRINKSLEMIYEIIGNVKVCIARELTKIYEEFIIDNIENLLDKEYKGEIVLIIENKKETKNIESIKKLINDLKKESISDKKISEIISSNTNFSKNEIYNYLKKKN